MCLIYFYSKKLNAKIKQKLLPVLRRILLQIVKILIKQHLINYKKRISRIYLVADYNIRILV